MDGYERQKLVFGHELVSIDQHYQWFCAYLQFYLSYDDIPNKMWPNYGT